MNTDVRWFRQRTRRNYRIRQPTEMEFDASFKQLGDHQVDRRRVIVWRVPSGNAGRRMVADGLMRIPFLLRSDESVDDSDEACERIMREIMKAAGEGQTFGPFIKTGHQEWKGFQ